MIKILSNGFLFTIAFVSFFSRPEIGFAQRMEPIDRPRDAQPSEPSKKEKQEARRRAAAEAARIRAENAAELQRLQDKINSDTNALKNEFESRLQQLDADWMKKFEGLKSEVLSQDVKERIQTEIENYIIDLLLQKKAEIVSISELRDPKEHGPALHSFFANLSSQKVDLPKYTPSDLGLQTLPPIQWSASPPWLQQRIHQGSRLSDSQRVSFEADGRAEAQKLLAQIVLLRSEELQKRWMNQLEAMMQNDSELPGMIHNLKQMADRVFDDEMEISQ